MMDVTLLLSLSYLIDDNPISYPLWHNIVGLQAAETTYLDMVVG